MRALPETNPEAQPAATADRGSEQPKQHIEVRDLVAGYNGNVVVRGLSMTVSKGEHVSLVGPSGCGKTTTLRCIAGLETPMSGEIVINGRTVFSVRPKVNIPAQSRGLSMVFQSYAVWPHMTVFDNVAYGLRVKRIRGDELRARVMETLELVGMQDFARSRATALSGGQQQRVALARAYAPHPDAVLLDEPLSNLDARLRDRVRRELRELKAKLGMTTIYVTHDQEEAMALSDRIIVMRAGEIEQEGTPQQIYATPRTSFVADFVGAANVFSGVLSEDEQGWTFVTGDASVRCAPLSPDVKAADGDGKLAVRPVFPRILPPDAAGPQENCWEARVSSRIPLGDVIDYTLDWPGGTISVRTSPVEDFQEDQRVTLHIPVTSAVPMAQ
jgi:iron(III) transport system ATP-binding protein